MSFYRFFTIWLLLSVAIVARAQTSAPEGVNVKLSLADNKTVYKIGEPIKLVMEFSADRDGYIVEFLPDNKDPGLDTIVVSPEAGVTRWLDDVNYRRASGRHVFSTDKLTNIPRRIEFFLNDTVRFDAPGHYTVSVNTRRIWLAKPGSNNKILPVSTNTVSFEVVLMTEADEEKEIKRIVDSLAATRDPRADYELGRQFSFLTGDPSTREKVKRYLANDNSHGNFNLHIGYGLFIARNRSLALKLVETALRDPNIPVTSQLLGLATSLKTLLTPGPRLVPEPTNPPPLEYPDPRATEIRDAYVTEVAAGLGKRSGDNQTTTAITILMLLPKDSQAASAGLREVRRILIQQFDSLPPISQTGLLEGYWEHLRDPALIPSLKKMMTTSGMSAKHLHEAAIKRLLELAPDEARPYVIAEIRDPSSFVDPAILGQLKDESLPEIDASLLDQIRTLLQSPQPHSNVYLKVKAVLLVRFATANIYRSVLELYQASKTKLKPDSVAGLLAYLAKHNEGEAVALIEQVLAEFKPGAYPSMLSELTELHYSEGIGALLKKLLETDDAAQASHAAYLIGKHGSAGDEQVLEMRLKRWREEWGNRIAEADAERQGQLERELIYALINGKSWKLPAERVKDLQQSCLTKLCKQYFQTQ